MRKWLNANGGWMALIILGLLTFVPQPVFGVLFLLAGGLLGLNSARWFPWKVVKESKLTLGVTDVNFTYGGEGVRGMQLNAWVKNLGAPTSCIPGRWSSRLRPTMSSGQR